MLIFSRIKKENCNEWFTVYAHITNLIHVLPVIESTSNITPNMFSCFQRCKLHGGSCGFHRLDLIKRFYFNINRQNCRLRTICGVSDSPNLHLCKYMYLLYIYTVTSLVPCFRPSSTVDKEMMRCNAASQSVFPHIPSKNDYMYQRYNQHSVTSSPIPQLIYRN